MIARRRGASKAAAMAALLIACRAGAQEAMHHHEGPALLGAYDPAREASGTSWEPEAGGMEGRHFTIGGWNAMVHAFAFGVFTDIEGPRGGRQSFGTNMQMLSVARTLGRGTFGLRAMTSLEPLMGRRGYRLLLQTGESADGVNHLVDRQHPHDLFMELAATYSRPLGDQTSAFVYAGLPGEPGLGPPAFMHRRSAMPNPSAPLGHHWLDSTHITFGIITAGIVRGKVKVDASVFKGREPDGARWNFDPPKLDSQSVRVTLAPSARVTMQTSVGWLHSPEMLHPTLNERRLTASLSWSPHVGLGALDITAAWGRKKRSGDLPNCFVSAGCYGGGIPYPPNRLQDAFLLEGALAIGARHTVFARGERVEKDELFPGLDPFHARVFPIGETTLGYLWAVNAEGRVGVRVGGAASLGFVPAFIAPDYGRQRVRSIYVIAQARLR